MEAGVTAVDLLDHLKGIERDAYRVAGDGHPNGRAFEAAARVLAPFVYEALETAPPEG